MSIAVKLTSLAKRRKGSPRKSSRRVSIRRFPVRPGDEKVTTRVTVITTRSTTMAKYMLIMRGTDEGQALFEQMDFTEVIAAMGRYNESMMDAGVLAAGEGLSDASEGAVVDFSSETPVVTDGPYGETKELFNGFWIVDVASKEEAVEWAKRAPL